MDKEMSISSDTFSTKTVKRIWELNNCPVFKDVDGSVVENHYWTWNDTNRLFGMKAVPQIITNDAWSSIENDPDLVYLSPEESKPIAEKLKKDAWVLTQNKKNVFHQIKKRSLSTLLVETSQKNKSPPKFVNHKRPFRAKINKDPKKYPYSNDSY